jgi:hypothetical protein
MGVRSSDIKTLGSNVTFVFTRSLHMNTGPILWLKGGFSPATRWGRLSVFDGLTLIVEKDEISKSPQLPTAQNLQYFQSIAGAGARI